jgi:hypothetical protein
MAHPCSLDSKPTNFFRVGSRRKRRGLEEKCTPKRFIWGIDAGIEQALAYISF